MSSNKRNAVVNVVLRSSSIIYLLVLGIALVPLYLEYIPVELYGYWLASGNIIAWIGDFTPVSAVMQQRVGVSFGIKDYNAIGKYIGTSLIISALILIVVSFALFGFYQLIFDWLDINNREYRSQLGYALAYAGIGLLLTMLSFGFSGINYGLQLFKSVGFLNLGINIVCIAATFLLLPDYGVQIFGITLLLRGFLDLICNIIILKRFLKKQKISVEFSKGVTKSLIGDISFNFVARIGNIVSKNSQLFFITKFVSPQSAVIFKITKTIPEISKYFIAMPAESILPVFSKYLGQKPSTTDVKSKVSMMIFYSTWAAGLVFIGFVLLNKIFIDLWVSDSFYAGDITNTLIVFWVVVSLLTNNLMYTVFALGDLRKNNAVLFFQSIILLALMLLLIKPLGIVGIALALVLAETIISLVYYPWSLQKYLQFNKQEVYRFFKELLYVGVTISLLYLLAYKIAFFPSSWHGFIGYVALCVLCYFVVLYLISQRFQSELKHLFFKSKLFVKQIF